MSSFMLLAETTGDVADAGKAIALALGIGLGSLGAGVGIGNIFGSMIQAVARQPELRGELTGIQWLGFALTEAVVFYGLIGGLLAFVLDLSDARCSLAATTEEESGGLIEVVPGLMIWTLIASRSRSSCSRSSRSARSRRRSTSGATASAAPSRRPTTPATRPASCSSSTGP